LSYINEDLKKMLVEHGADLVGFADLKSIVQGDMTFGVSVAVAVPREVILGIQNGPTMDYYDAYHRINKLLDHIVTAGAEYLTAKGYQAFAQTTDAVVESDDYRTALPHKTVATRAGLGWIGKCALLVTKEYGSAVRLSSLITNAPLDCGVPITESRCGNCMVCTEACPGKAVSGKLWNAEIDRDNFFQPLQCRKKARELAAERIHKEITLCGKCIESCPYTQRYLNRVEN
jgi:epoxyqueuosine reductase